MKEALKRLMRSLTYRLGYQNLDHVSLLLYSRLAKTRDFFILQIGANDGTTYDPIHQFIVRNRQRVRGIFLEPLPDLHAQLERTYQDFPGIQTLPLAVHATEPTMVIHRVDPAKLAALPAFARGIASFDPKHHEKSGTPPDVIIRETVNCISMYDLLTRYAINKIDLLCIDAEGYDAEILRTFDFDRLQPTIVMFEHGLRHDVMRGDAFLDVIKLLNGRGYDVMVQDYDVVAHLRDRLGIV